MAERIFGATILNSDGKAVPVRYIGEQHVKEDLGRIPSFQDWIQEMRTCPWMYGQRNQPRHHGLQPETHAQYPRCSHTYPTT